MDIYFTWSETDYNNELIEKFGGKWHRINIDKIKENLWLKRYNSGCITTDIINSKNKWEEIFGSYHQIILNVEKEYKISIYCLLRRISCYS